MTAQRNRGFVFIPLVAKWGRGVILCIRCSGQSDQDLDGVAMGLFLCARTDTSLRRI